MTVQNNRLNKLLSLLESDLSDSFLLFAIAKEYEGLGNIQKAVNYYNQLKNSDPGYIGLYYHLGKAYESLNHFEYAINTYTTGIAVAEEQKDLHSLRELKEARSILELELD